MLSEKRPDARVLSSFTEPDCDRSMSMLLVMGTFCCGSGRSRSYMKLYEILILACAKAGSAAAKLQHAATAKITNRRIGFPILDYLSHRVLLAADDCCRRSINSGPGESGCR